METRDKRRPDGNVWQPRYDAGILKFPPPFPNSLSVRINTLGGKESKLSYPRIQQNDEKFESVYPVIGGLQPFPRDSNSKDPGGHVEWQEL